MKSLLKKLTRRIPSFGGGQVGPTLRHDLDFGSYIVQPGSAANDSQGMVRPLYTPEQMANAVAELKRELAADDASQTRAALRGEIARGIERFRGHWFQRIAYPQHHLTSTSDHSWAYIDEGGLNTLGNRLTSAEASILRPWPKWTYIQPLLPDLHGKTVLELGSSNGFFCFQFAGQGAERVTGVEIIRSQYESALWSTEVLGHENVRFLNTDGLLDLSIEPHDVVFLSEVHNHFLCPFYGLLRMVNLARETVIFDTGAIDTPELSLNLHTAWNKENGRLIYHSFALTDGFIMDFLKLIGIPASRVIRYKAPFHEYHILYVIDTRDMEQHRRDLRYPEYLEDVMRLRFRK